MSDTELVALQLHRNAWYARTARRILQQRGGNPLVYAALTKILTEDPRTSHRLRALWALHVTGGLTSEVRLQQLSSPDEYVRAWTVQLALEDGVASPGLVAKLESLARSDASPVVRLYLASALQRLPIADRWRICEHLIGRAEDRNDQNLPLMLWYGLEPCVLAAPEQAMRLAKIAKIPDVARYIVRRLAADDDPRFAILVATAERADASLQALILDEMLTAMRSQDHVAMPQGWRRLAARLDKSPELATRDQTSNLAALFGDAEAQRTLRTVLADRKAPLARRERALETLVHIKDEAAVPLLQSLIQDSGLAYQAIRGLAKFDAPDTPALLIGRYQKLRPKERRAAVQTLSGRAVSALALLKAVVAKRLPKTVLDATTRRKIGKLEDANVDQLMVQAWGRSTPLGADKEKQIAKWKKRLSPRVLDQANLPAGRAVFERTCMRCHSLFGVGRDVGPDLTGSNRADLTYILRNVLDPSGEVAKDYLATTVLTKQEQLLEGILVADSGTTITLKNATDTEVIARADIALDEHGKPDISTSPTSIMPEGQLDALTFTEVRDLIGYLRSDEQVPMAATPTNLGSFFNERDLTGWDADPSLWSVERGELVGRTTTGLRRNRFARSRLLLRDFRLILEVKLIDNRGNSGIQFRSQALDDGEMKGYQADIGVGWWGKLYEERLRGLLSKKPGDPYVHRGEWNRYEILAVGDHVRTAINGKLCVDLRDPKGRREGVFGFQLHSGGPTEVRFKDLRLELDPTDTLKTIE